MKYAVLLLALMFAGCDEAPSTEGVQSTDGGYEIKIKGRTILVAKEDIPEDFPSDMSRDDAMAACQNLGNGWRLPSSEEYAAMYEQLHTKGKGNFSTEGLYWSNSGYFEFEEGREPSGNGGVGAYPTLLQVRAVRALP